MSNVYLAPYFYDSIIQGTWSAWSAEDDNSIDQLQIYNSTHNDGDGLSYKAFFSAGTYTMKFFHMKGTNRGIADISLGSSVLLQQDLYDGSFLLNQVATVTGTSVSSSGVKTVSIVCNGKNVASSEHYLIWYGITFYRTA